MLDSYTKKIEEGSIGSVAQPFLVRVPSLKRTRNEANEKNSSYGVDYYPSLRRAHRLSYIIFILLESFVVTASPIGTEPDNPRQQLLEITSLSDRLEEAYDRLEEISAELRKVLDERGL